MKNVIMLSVYVIMWSLLYLEKIIQSASLSSGILSKQQWYFFSHPKFIRSSNEPMDLVPACAE